MDLSQWCTAGGYPRGQTRISHLSEVFLQCNEYESRGCWRGTPPSRPRTCRTRPSGRSRPPGSPPPPCRTCRTSWARLPTRGRDGRRRLRFFSFFALPFLPFLPPVSETDDSARRPSRSRQTRRPWRWRRRGATGKLSARSRTRGSFVVILGRRRREAAAGGGQLLPELRLDGVRDPPLGRPWPHWSHDVSPRAWLVSDVPGADENLELVGRPAGGALRTMSCARTRPAPSERSSHGAGRSFWSPCPTPRRRGGGDDAELLTPVRRPDRQRAGFGCATQKEKRSHGASVPVAEGDALLLRPSSTRIAQHASPPDFSSARGGEPCVADGGGTRAGPAIKAFDLRFF